MHHKIKNPGDVNGSGRKEEMNSSAWCLGSVFEATLVRVRSGSQLKCLSLFVQMKKNLGEDSWRGSFLNRFPLDFAQTHPTVSRPCDRTGDACQRLLVEKTSAAQSSASSVSVLTFARFRQICLLKLSPFQNGCNFFSLTVQAPPSKLIKCTRPNPTISSDQGPCAHPLDDAMTHFFFLGSPPLALPCVPHLGLPHFLIPSLSFWCLTHHCTTSVGEYFINDDVFPDCNQTILSLFVKLCTWITGENCYDVIISWFYSFFKNVVQVKNLFPRISNKTNFAERRCSQKKKQNWSWSEKPL